MDKEVLNLKMVAEFLNASEIWIKKMVREKKIPSHKIGGKRVFLKEEILDWIKSQKNGGDENKTKKKKK